MKISRTAAVIAALACAFLLGPGTASASVSASASAGAQPLGGGCVGLIC
ncbi:hypothetical protein [Streptosporangium sandarakinum]|uniref:Uncharacterized protein n=1 Tax=Streptosporangium sandarakinum TaxID=1260955 RepID=A0A852V3N8_9ACTN|nr:hypothetical protein [Streptosporangium sandarakinum]NYF44437.1 hypothetical protein [Streptosporangium sandarakinum]